MDVFVNALVQFVNHCDTVLLVVFVVVLTVVYVEVDKVELVDVVVVSILRCVGALYVFPICARHSTSP